MTRKPNMFILMAIGTGVALGFSLAAVLVPGRFPSVFLRADGSVAVYFESAAVIITLVFQDACNFIGL